MDQSEANYRTERGSGGMLKSNFSNNCSCTSKIVIKVGSSIRRYRARFCKSGKIPPKCSANRVQVLTIQNPDTGSCNFVDKSNLSPDGPGAYIRA